MIRKLSISLAALAAMGIAGAASAQDTVAVSINVSPFFDFAVNDAAIQLDLTAANAENSDATASGISYNSNVEGDLSAEVSGTWPPVSTIAGSELNFFIFGGESDPSAALTAIAGNSNAPIGAAAWNVNNDGATQLIGSSLPIQPLWGSHYDIVYAASAPNEAPPPNSYSLTVTYTVAPL